MLFRSRGVVLVVDDDAPVLELAQEFLERAGFRVLTASSDAEALRQAREQPIEVVVLDAVLPGVAGEELLRRLRSARPDVPVLLVTGFGDDATVRRFEAAGVADVLRKPYESEALIDRVSAALCEAREPEGS